VGRLLPVEGDEDDHQHIERNMLRRWDIGLFFLFIVITLLRSTIFRRIASIGRMAQNYTGMLWAWSMFTHGDWYWQHKVGTHNLTAARLCNAFFITAASFISLVVVDMIADRCRQYSSGKGWNHLTRIGTAFDIYGGLDELREDVYQQDQGGDSDSDQDERIPAEEVDAVNLLDPQAMATKAHRHISHIKHKIVDPASLEKTLRTVVGVFGFLVGLCWEKTFSGANEVLFHGILEFNFAWAEEWSLHPIVLKSVCTTLLVFFVLTSWAQYLVPYAQMHDLQHLYGLLSEELSMSAPSRKVTLDMVETLERRLARNNFRSIEQNDVVKAHLEYCDDEEEQNSDWFHAKVVRKPSRENGVWEVQCDDDEKGETYSTKRLKLRTNSCIRNLMPCSR